MSEAPDPQPVAVADPEAIEARLRMLEAFVAQRLAPAPMAAPPITIGPFNNVPAPGSPIRSDWPQSISTYVANNLPVRNGCALTATQSIPNGVATDIIWTGEDYDTNNYHAPNATQMIVPAGLGGVYALWVWYDAGGTVSGVSAITVWSGASINGVTQIPAASRFGNATLMTTGPAAHAFRVSLTHNHSTAATFTFRCWLARVSL
ncbi:MAG TPA: hypothetical protein VIX41_08835 [Acidimicrobiales bacterium]